MILLDFFLFQFYLLLFLLGLTRKIWMIGIKVLKYELKKKNIYNISDCEH